MRDLKTIDAELEIERTFLALEETIDHGDRDATSRRVDRLLDERADVVRAMQDATPRPVDDRLVYGPGTPRTPGDA